jgi:hypothetical protein
MRDEVIGMIKSGKSLNAISKETDIAKSSLYFHYKKLFGKKYKTTTTNKDSKEDLGEFIGVFAGDGNYFFDRKKYHHRIRIYTGHYEKDYSKYLSGFLTKLFSKPPRVYKNSRKDVIISEYCSRDIYSLIKEYLEWETDKTKEVRLKNIDKLEQEFLIGFLRGIFDTDGGINLKKNKAAFGTSSKNLAYQIKNILESLDLKPGFYKYKDKGFWYIDLYGSRTDRFMKLIKPNNPNKVIKRC